ncbi:MAG TPA: helix-turn-helix domain-containing protein [Acetobacteraceae bacterium]|nr:helix-turn-helix domain-containing protein [Acetobacteraceae bacterium]
MRVSREQAAENHERIVEAASRLFRQQGFDGVSVDAIMQDAGLTHGGFYGHFKSKEDLAARAVARALAKATERQKRYTDLGDLVSDYLSQRHCDDRGNGCVIAALGADIVRQGSGVRGGLTAHVRSQFDRFARLIKGGTAANRRKRAIATLAGIVGAMTLARAVEDPALSKEILAAAREIFGKAPGGPAVGAAD